MKRNIELKQQITEAQIQEALREFLARGGIVRRLPAQRVYVVNTVGQKYGLYEDINWLARDFGLRMR